MPEFRSYVAARLGALQVPPEREQEIVRELAEQMQQAYADALGGGCSEQDALETARAQFPDWDALAHDINAAERQRPCRSYGGPRRRTTGILHDLRHGLRLLRAAPGFTALAVLTLAFAIGGNTAIFTVVDAIALRGLPYRSPHELMAIETHKVREPEIESWTSAPDFFDMRRRLRSFSSLAAISPVWNLVLLQDSRADQIDSLYVSADFFPMLGVKPAAGRFFSPEEDRAGRPSNVAVVSYAFWQARFGGSPAAVGETLNLNGVACTIVGVLPRDFRYLGEPLSGTAMEIHVWLPLASNALLDRPRSVRFLKVIGRLRPGVPARQAGSELNAFSAALREQYPDTNRGLEYRLDRLEDQVQGRIRPTLLLLLGAIAFVFLLACANVAQLLLVRGAARQREFSVRLALGASAGRLLRQLLAEGLVLAAAAATAGVLFAFGVLKFLTSTGPPAIFQARKVALDPAALAFTAAVMLLSAVLSGLPPAWRILLMPVAASLRHSSRTATASGRRLRSALVALQAAVALALLIGAGLLIHSFVRLLAVDPGFHAGNTVTISTQLPATASDTPEKRAAAYRLIRDRLLAMPGVDDVGAVSRLPLMGSNLGSWLFIQGRPSSPGNAPEVEYRVATPSYFHVMAIPLVQGRLFDEHDTPANPVALINEVAARKFWPDGDAIGARVSIGPNPARWVTIVGVVGNVRHFGLDIEPRPELYRPFNDSPLYAPILVMRTAGDPGPLMAPLAAAVRSALPELPAYNVFRMSELVDRSLQARRFVMLLLCAFAAAALLLACAGCYGAASQTVVQRTREIGVRMALGASPQAAVRLVLVEGLRLSAVGIAVGVLVALGLTRLVRGMLFNVQPLDPAAFLVAALSLEAVTLIACYIPARRATRIDPLAALRDE